MRIRRVRLWRRGRKLPAAFEDDVEGEPKMMGEKTMVRSDVEKASSP